MSEVASGHGPEVRTLTIVVNGRATSATKTQLSFAEIVALAFPQGTTGDNTAYTVTYRRGHGEKPEGTLVEGQMVKLKDGMIFNVTATDKS
ncbi:multiubiquitin domain-containing protein [Roseisolibacter agri]|uniref:Multi-ubiquitin domain-containing protein n=1 Tax=Roseisolibacter agri TaxID=2014610 RepID=A0AA37QL32_9BACT|nr:multiubiquitin domain-containing protein [Roseisolibacter agri]GLC27773.1 hypothetical protein rosag_42860 [Roseisolibacter agri]